MQVRQGLKPTLLCPHYIFSLRDLNAVISGMMLQTEADIQQSSDSPENEHLRLWTHEVLRVFYDRVQDPIDKAWFLKMLKMTISQHLQVDFNVLFQHLDLNNDGEIDADELRRLFFGSFQVSTRDRDPEELPFIIPNTHNADFFCIYLNRMGPGYHERRERKWDMTKSTGRMNWRTR